MGAIELPVPVAHDESNMKCRRGFRLLRRNGFQRFQFGQGEQPRGLEGRNVMVYIRRVACFAGQMHDGAGLVARRSKTIQVKAGRAFLLFRLIRSCLTWHS